jgi:apolipoprotein N-acyltransferase
MIDPYGRITGSLELGEAGVIDAALPLPLAPTPYARAGDLPAFILLAAALGALTLRRLRRRVAR